MFFCRETETISKTEKKKALPPPSSLLLSNEQSVLNVVVGDAVPTPVIVETLIDDRALLEEPSVTTGKNIVTSQTVEPSPALISAPPGLKKKRGPIYTVSLPPTASASLVSPSEIIESVSASDAGHKNHLNESNADSPTEPVQAPELLNPLPNPVIVALPESSSISEAPLITEQIPGYSFVLAFDVFYSQNS